MRLHVCIAVMSLTRLVGRHRASLSPLLRLVQGAGAASRSGLMFFHGPLFMDCSPPDMLTYSPSEGNSFLIFFFLQEPLLAPEFRRPEVWEGSAEEHPGRASAAGRMVSLSQGCGGGVTSH